MPEIQVILNHPKTELLRPGHSRSRLGSTLIACKYAGPEGNEDTNVGRYWPEIPLPKEFWREPETGVIMLAPGSIITDSADRDKYRVTFLNKTEVRGMFGAYSAGPKYTITQNDVTGELHVGREGLLDEVDEATFDGITGRLALQAILAIVRAQDSAAFALQSKDPFLANEGITVNLIPYGAYTDSAEDYFALAFGGRYAISLHMSGEADLYANLGTEAVPDVRRVATFTYFQGKRAHGQSLQISIIPWGFDYISFLFSWTAGGKQTKSGAGKEKTFGYLYKISDHEAYPRYVPTETGVKHYIKTEAMPVTIGLKRAGYAYSMQIGRIRYPTELQTIVFRPEFLHHLHPGVTPFLNAKGFAGGGTPPCSLVPTFRNGLGETWDAATDKLIFPGFAFLAGAGGAYTPELWSYDIGVPPTTQMPDSEDLDVSANWQYIRFSRSCEVETCMSDVKLGRPSALPSMFRRGGPVRIKIGGIVVYDGYALSKEATLEGPLAIYTEKLECQDELSSRLRRRIKSSKHVDGAKVLDTIKDWLRAVGYADSDIEVSDADGYIAALTIPGFKDPNDQLGFNDDATYEDALKEIFKRYAGKPVRVRSVGEKVKIYKPSVYDSEDPPGRKFFLRTEGADFAEARGTDTERYENLTLYALSDPEFTIPELQFNALVGRASEGTGDGAKGIEYAWTGKGGDGEKSQTDGEDVNFIGQYKEAIVSPPEITARTEFELAWATRVYFANNAFPPPLLEFLGEWTPEIDCDDFIWLIGIDKDGTRVSYGAWRIITMDVEIRRDSYPGKTWQENEEEELEFLDVENPPSPDKLASYFCEWAGSAEDEDTPMFVELLPKEVALP